MKKWEMKNQKIFGISDKRFKKIFTEMKEMSDAEYESTMSQASIYQWYNKFKNGRCVELTSWPGTPTTVLTELTSNTGASMIFDNPHLTVRPCASLLDISIMSTCTLQPNSFFFVCVCLTDSTYSHHNKKCLHWSVPPIFDRAGTQQCWLLPTRCGLIVTISHSSSRWVNEFYGVLLVHYATKLKIKYLVVAFSDWEGLVYARTVPDGQIINVDWYTEILKWLLLYIPGVGNHIVIMVNKVTWR